MFNAIAVCFDGTITEINFDTSHKKSACLLVMATDKVVIGCKDIESSVHAL